MVKVDSRCQCVSIQPVNGLVRIDGMPLCQIVVQGDGKTWLRFRDRDRIRNRQRGSEYIEIPLSEFVKVLTKE